MRFRWNSWNVAHIAEHAVLADEAEQVVFVADPDKTIYVIHARDLTDAEKHRYRRRMR